MGKHLGPYPADFVAVRAIRGDLEAELTSLELDRKTIDDVLLGVTETATNSIRHGKPAPRQVDLKLDLTPSRIEVTVIDDGGPAECLAAHLHAAADQEITLGEGGMGLGLITSLFPDHDHRIIDGHNHLSIRRTLERKYKPRIALIDDDEVMGRLLASYLEADYKVSFYNNAETALAAIISKPPDLIISDIDMPDMDGMALRRRLQPISSCVMVPFIFLTGLECQIIEDKANDLGIDEFIAKPISKRRVNGLVARVLRRSHQLRNSLAPQLDAAVVNSLRTDLPATIHGYNLCAVERACEVGGGDIVLLKTHSGYADLFLIDVMGHGLPAKLFAHLYAGFINGLVRAAPRQTNLSAFLVWLSEALQSEPALSKSLLTCLVMRLHEGREIEFVNAGHPRPLLIDDQGRVQEIVVDGPLLGLGIEDYQAVKVRLGDDHRVLAFTDGLIDGLGLPNAKLHHEIGQVWRRSVSNGAFGQNLLRCVDDALELGHGHADDTTILTLSCAGFEGGCP